MSGVGPATEPADGAGSAGGRPPTIVAGTTLRFVLLLMTVLTAIVTMVTDLLRVLPPQDQQLACDLALGFDPASGELENLLRTGDPAQLERCVSSLPAAGRWRELLAVSAVLAVAVVLYLWLPRWRNRASRVVPLAQVDPDGAVRAELVDLAQRAGLPAPPAFVVDPTSTARGAVTYGWFGRRTVRLHGGLLLTRVSDPDAFRATVLHEYAHLRNGDVGVSYAVVALFRTFAVLVTAPYLLAFAGTLVAAQFFGWFVGADGLLWPAARPVLVWQLVVALFLLAMVQLSRADILRHRELHADADAVAVGADPRVWTAAAGRAGRSRGLRPAWLRGLLLTHPSWRERQRSLDDPASLFALSGVQFFLLGWVALYLPAQLDRFVPAELAAGLVAIPVGAVVVISVWRATTYAVATGRPTPTGVSAGTCLGAGLVLGEVSSAFGNGPQWFPPHPEVLLVLPLTAVAFVGWVAGCARLRLTAWRGGGLQGSLGMALGVSVLVAVAGLTLWQRIVRLRLVGDVATAFGLGDSLTRAFPDPWSAHQGELRVLRATLPDLAVAGRHLLVVVAAVLLWLFPLLAWIRWAPWSSDDLPSVRRLVLPGLAGGAACLAGILAVMAYQHSWQPPQGELRSGAFALLYAWWVLVVGWAGSALTAAAVMVVARRYALLRALVAAGLAQLVALGGFGILASVDGCLGPLRTMGDSCHVLPEAAWPILALLTGPTLTATFGAVLLAGLAILLVAPVRAVVTRGRVAAPAASDVDGQAAGGRARMVGAAVICAGALLAAGTAAYAARPGSGTGALAGAAPSAPASTASPKLRAMQLLMWWKLGGQAHVLDLTEAYVQYHRFIEQLVNAPPNASDGTVPLDVATLRSRCEALRTAATDGERFIRVPDGTLQRRWAEVLSRTRRGAEDCLRAVDGPDEWAPLEAALRGLLDSEQQVVPAVESLNAAITDALEQWPGLRRTSS